MQKCIHLIEQPNQEHATVEVTGSNEVLFDLCTKQCLEVWRNDIRRNPLESQGYNIYRSADPDIAKDQWSKVNDKPIPHGSGQRAQYRLKDLPDGAHYYVTAVNALGFESDPSEVVTARDTPKVVLKSVLLFKETTDEGKLVEAVTLPWFEIIEILKKDPEAAFQISDRIWEEIIAGAYHRAGFDDVTLTPRSGDFGRDVIAVKRGIGTVRVIDQVKAYKRDHLVNANDVRALVGVLHGDGASKGFLTTTSDFAPKLKVDPLVTPFIPSRLELINGESLLKRLVELGRK